MSELNYIDRALWGQDFNPEWEMTSFERLAFSALVDRIRPRFTLEIGSRRGGSLQILSRVCPRIVSLDIDETVPTRLRPIYPSVEFRTGDSRTLLPALLQEFQEAGTMPDFIFIDGDHTSEGASSDLRHALSIKPQTRTWVLMHDTFNPDVRKGIRTCDPATFPHVHFADLDFAPGIWLSEGPLKGEIWGGFSLFILDPEPRQGALAMGQAWQNMWERVMAA